MSSGKYHRAAKDGHIDLLKDGNRRDLNLPDEDGMSAVHWAAYSGHLEALRVTIGRGGDPDKPDLWGSTPLHLAARTNRINCVSFLVNFGANIWCLDNDGQSALDVTALRGHAEVVKYLDEELSRQMTRNPRDATRKKEKALVDAEKRAKKWQKMVKRCEKSPISATRLPASAYGSSAVQQPKNDKLTMRCLNQKMRETLRFSKNQNSKTELVIGPPMLIGSEPHAVKKSFSDFVLENTGTSRKPKIPKDRPVASNERPPSRRNDQHGKTTNVIYANPREENGADSGISGDMSPEAPSLFERPGFGTVSFRPNSFSETLLNVRRATSSEFNDPPDAEADIPWKLDEIGLTDDDEMLSPLEAFLQAHNLEDYTLLFCKERITLDALMLMTESDLQQLGMPLGPRKLLMDAVLRRRQAINHPGPMVDMRI